jgi:uncharacterized membrane protein YvlD (DUF360 family)
MVRFLWSFAVNLVSAAAGLLLARLLLADFHLEMSGFLIAVLVLTVAQAILAPFVFSMGRKYAPALLGGIGIVSTMLALFVASRFPGGIDVTGFATWVLAALVVWIVMALGGWLLLGWVLKRFVRSGSASGNR